MSAAFKVGDRVRWHIGESRGVVTAIGNVTGMVRVRWDSEAHGEGHYQEQALLRSVEPTTVGDLVHPSGAKVEAGTVILTPSDAEQFVSGAAWKALTMLHNANQDKANALDTVRKFLGAHSFASCSLACNRELREVMAVVLKALDAERGDTW